MSKPNHVFIGGPVYRAYSGLIPLQPLKRHLRFKVHTLRRFADELHRQGGIIGASEFGYEPIGVILDAWVGNDDTLYISAKLSGGPELDDIFARLLSGDISRFGNSVDLLLGRPDIPEQFLAVDISTYSQSEEGRIVYVNRDRAYERPAND